MVCDVRGIWKENGRFPISWGANYNDELQAEVTVVVTDNGGN